MLFDFLNCIFVQARNIPYFSVFNVCSKRRNSAARFPTADKAFPLNIGVLNEN
jgi:hypothetical protein